MMDGSALGGTARDWIGDLSDAAASFDWPCVTESIEEYVAYLRSTPRLVRSSESWIR